MAGFRPIGSEKLQGMDKIRRIMEIARYNENIPQNINETQSSEYKIGLADGNTYEIVKERQGYIVKKTLNESETEYIEPMKQRKYYSSYSQALKRLNLMTKEINTLFENEEGTPLLGEQKKKFILKSKKPKTEEPAAAATPEPAPDPEAAPTPEASPAPTEAPMPDMGEMPDMGGAPMEEPPMPDMGGAPTEEPPMPDMGMGEMPNMGGEEEMPPMPEMGSEEEEVDIDVEKKPKEKKVSDLKRIQILTGKLAQKIRSYEEEKELDPKDIKYIINSILSAIDVDVLDEDDIEQIINKLEGVEDEEGGSEEEEVSFEEKSDEEEVAPEPPQEPEMAEGYDDFSTAFKDYMGGALASGMSKKLRHEEEDFDMDDEYHRERRKGRKHYPNVDRFEHGTFSESTVDKVLSKYFINEETQINKYEESKTKKTSLNYNQNKQNVIRLSESSNQLDVALEYIKENPRTKLMGLSTRGNLIFKEGINETKITKSGEII
jgi:hypothetical protein